MGKGSTTQNSSQSSNPPAWALPLFKQAAGDAAALYGGGQGYNVYRGPTQAEFSPQKLQALNKILTMTGGGTPVTNEAIFSSQNPQIAQIQGLIAQQQQQQAAYKAAQAAAAAAAAKKKAPARRTQQEVLYKAGGGRSGNTGSSPGAYGGARGGYSTSGTGAKSSATGGKGKGGLY